MNYLASLLLGAALLFSSAAFAVTTTPTEPTIESIRGRMVKIRVPAGFDRVTLQQLVVPRTTAGARASDRWRTLATKYPRGTESVVSVRLPTLIAKRFLRVYGNKTEPLAGSLLTGIANFLPDAPEAELTVNPALNKDSVSPNNLVPGNAGASDTTPRTVAEADIWKVQGNRVYFFNELRGLQVFDLANPAAPALLGTLRLPGAGDDLYLLGNTHAVLLKQASGGFGWPVYFGGGLLTIGNAANLAVDAGGTRLAVQPQGGGTGSGEIIVADVRDGAPKLVARVPYDGSLAESRMVGSVLYLATNVWHLATDKDAAEYGVQLSSFDLSDPAAPVARGTLFLGGWANAVTATDKFFLVAKYAQFDGSWTHNTIDLIDISAPDGTMKRAGQATVRGNISSKFNLNIDGDVLTAVAQNWGHDGDEGSLVFRPVSFTDVQTFSIANPNAPALLGSISLAPGETVRASRFDADRVYVVTFRQVDPLFVVNLKDPARPVVSGEVQAPGFSTYIEPLGDRLVTIGLVNWRPAVSLFDVADPAAPKLLSQIMLGAEKGWSHSEAVWNEKAFKVLPDDNLILVPVVGTGEDNGWFSRVQLIDLLPNKLVKRGAIVREFSPRRATVIGNCVVAISPTRLVTVNAADRDKPVVKADLEIAWSVNRVFNVGKFLVQIGGSADWGDTRAPSLTISPADDTDDTLTSLDLANLPVRGATVKDDVLYLAQGEPGYWIGNATDELAKRVLTASAYDLSRLPAVRLLGRVSTRAVFSYGDLTPHWPSPGILVWSGSTGGWNWVGNIWYDPAPYTVQKTAAATHDGDGTEVIDPPGYWTTRWFYSHAARLTAFDFTRPVVPAFLSDITVGAGKAWDLSEPFESDGAVLLSYKFLGNVKPAENATDTNSAAAESPRASRHYLVRADYADPAAPVIDDTQINLPGRLTGLARSGKLLFTIGRNYDLAAGTAKSTGSALQVSAFDGTAAHLLDTLPLVSPWQPVSIQGDTIFTLDGQAEQFWKPWPYLPGPVLIPFGTDVAPNSIWGGGGSWEVNPKTSLLSAWRLDAAGKFTKLSEIEAAHDTSLFVFGGLVVTQDSNRTLHLFDGSNPAKIASLGKYQFDGWVWPDLGNASGALDTGLWVPLDRYGVETVATPAGAK